MENQNSETHGNKINLIITSVTVLVVFLVLLAGAYIWVNKKSKDDIAFPAGINYVGPQTQTTTDLTPVPTIDIAQVGKSGKWLKSGGKIYKYQFIYPAELQITAFMNDPTDKLAWVTGITSPQKSIVFNVEKMSDLGAQYTNRPLEFAKNYWKKFPGLSGVKIAESVTNQKNLTGFRAIYVDKANNIANTNYFFPIPNDPDHILQVINGVLPEDVFNNIVNSIEFAK